VSNTPNRPVRALAVWLALAGLALPAPLWAADVETHTLPNGLKVVLKEEHKAPVISFQVWYNVGSRNEQVGRTGLSHMLEHMMFKGTKRRAVGDYARIVARNGGNENAFTSRDYTAYFMNWAPEHLPLSVDLEADRMTGLVVDPQQFKLEREVVEEERRMRIDDNPVMTTVEQMYATAYMAHPYGNPVIGWMSDLDRLTADDLVAYYRRYYAPDNATVVVVGDFDAAEALAEIEKGFGPLPAAQAPPEVRAQEPPQAGERRIIVRKQAQLPFVLLGYHTPNWQSPDAYPLAVLARLLFEGKRSRIYQRLIYADQVAVDGGGEYDPLSVDPQLFYFYATVAPGHTTDEAEQAIYDEVARLQAEPPDDRELARARNQVEAGYVLAQDSVFYQAMHLGEAETVGAGVDYAERFPERIRQVTAEDVRRVAAKYLVPDNRTVAVLAPEPAPGSGEGPQAEPGGPGPEGGM
jgi:zinc protease